MNSRDLNKRIEIRGEQSVSDGYGGYVVQDVLLSNSWAQIKSLSAGKTWNLADLGLIQTNSNVFITVRKRNDLVYNAGTMYFVYRGLKYTIGSQPDNINFDDRFVTFIGSAAQKKGNATPTP